MLRQSDFRDIGKPLSGDSGQANTGMRVLPIGALLDPSGEGCAGPARRGREHHAPCRGARAGKSGPIAVSLPVRR